MFNRFLFFFFPQLYIGEAKEWREDFFLGSKNRTGWPLLLGAFFVLLDAKNGRNVVELFVAAPNSKKLNKPEKELRNYAKTKLLKPGETETITMTVATEDLASFNEKASAWKTDAGVYTFMICSSANDVEAKATAKVKAWTKKVNNVMKPNVKLNLLHR